MRFLIIGGGPAGNTAATVAARLGAEVTLVEAEIVGGGAHLLDCIPSKTMAATSVRMEAIRSAQQLGIEDQGAGVDLEVLNRRMATISHNLSADIVNILTSQGVDILRGRGRFLGPHRARVDLSDGGSRELDFDVALIATGSAPREPGWAEIDGDRIFTTRQAYSLSMVPEHLVIVGSGVTGVEFVHIFSFLGSRVTLIVSRQQVLPHRDPEVATVLEADFLERGVTLMKGARANRISRDGDEVVVDIEDGRRAVGSHAMLAIGSVPLTADLGLDAVGVELTASGHVQVDEYQRTSVSHIYAAGDVTGQLPLSSVASMQGRKIARHVTGRQVTPIDYSKVAEAIFTDPEIASVGLEEADAAAEGRKVRITKVPFSANPRSIIHGATRGFVKMISDPATHVVLGGTIVGHRASELIGILALAVQGGLRVDTLLETLMVHPSLSESLVDAAE